MAEALKGACSITWSTEDEQAEEREREAIQSGPLSQRFEVGAQARVWSTSGTRDGAVRDARGLARTERVQVIVRDTMARRGAEQLWLLREDGTIRRIARRVGNPEVDKRLH